MKLSGRYIFSPLLGATLRAMNFSLFAKSLCEREGGGKEGGRERCREGGRERGREGGRKRGREGEREREREGGRRDEEMEVGEGEREGGRERGREGGRE